MTLAAAWPGSASGGLPADVIANTSGLLAIAANCNECEICDLCNPNFPAWLENHIKGRKFGSCRQGTHVYPCNTDGERPCDENAACPCLCPANPKWVRCGLMRPGGRRGVARKGGAQHGQERDDAKFGSLREIKRVVTSEDGAIVDDDALPDFADIAALVSDRICETLKHDSVAAARMAPTVVEAEARARLSNLLRDTCIAVVRSACGAFIDPKTTFAGAPGYGRAERAAAGTFTLSPAMIADIKAQPERRNVNRVLEHLRGLEKYPEVEWIQTSAVAALLKQLSNQESREAAGGVSDLVRASKGPGGLADVVRALGKWYVKDMKAALTDVFKLSDAGNRADLTNRIAAAVVSGGEAAVLAAEASAAVAVPANAAAVSAAVASNNDVPMGTSGDAMEGGAPPPLLQAAAAAAAVASGGACRAAQNSYALRTFAHRCWFFLP